MDVENLKTELRSRVVTVTFTKKNGDLRKMDCTLNLQLVPPSKWPKDKTDVSENVNQSAVRVYDVKAGGWRSFLISNVIEAI